MDPEQLVSQSNKHQKWPQVRRFSEGIQGMFEAANSHAVAHFIQSMGRTQMARLL
jgi:hypothetical protein